MNTLRQDIEQAINRHSAENGSNTPDFILAEFLTGCLAAFDKAVQTRNTWMNCHHALTPSAPVREITYFCTVCGCENLHGPTCPDCLLRQQQEAAAAENALREIPDNDLPL